MWSILKTCFCRPAVFRARSLLSPFHWCNRNASMPFTPWACPTRVRCFSCDLPKTHQKYIRARDLSLSPSYKSQFRVSSVSTGRVQVEPAKMLLLSARPFYAVLCWCNVWRNCNFKAFAPGRNLLLVWQSQLLYLVLMSQVLLRFWLLARQVGAKLHELLGNESRTVHHELLGNNSVRNSGVETSPHLRNPGFKSSSCLLIPPRPSGFETSSCLLNPPRPPEFETSPCLLNPLIPRTPRTILVRDVFQTAHDNACMCTTNLCSCPEEAATTSMCQNADDALCKYCSPVLQRLWNRDGVYTRMNGSLVALRALRKLQTLGSPRVCTNKQAEAVLTTIFISSWKMNVCAVAVQDDVSPFRALLSQEHHQS